MLLVAIVYNGAGLSVAMPRAGGDYVFGSRIVHPIWGMIPSFMLLFSAVFGIPAVMIVALQAFLAPLITTLYPSQASMAASLFYTSPLNLFIITSVVIILVFGLAMLKTKAYFYFMRVVFVFGMIMALVLIAFLLSQSHSAVIANYDSQSLTGFNSSATIANATSAGWTTNVAPSALTTSAALIYVLFFLMAGSAATYLAGEIKQVNRSMPVGFIGGQVLGWVIAAAGILAFVGLFGYNFLSAFGFEAYLNPIKAASGSFGPFVLILAIIPNHTIDLLIGVSFVLGTFAFAAVPLMPASRMIFAWSFDRMIPERFSYVSARTGTPLISLAFLTGLSIILAGVYSYYSSTLGGLLATTIIVSIAFLPNAISAILLPYRRKSIFQSSPKFVNRKIGGIPVLVITGAIHAVGLVTILILTFLNPIAAGTTNGIIGSELSTAILLGLLASILFYPISRAIRRRRDGIDLKLLFNEIPVE